MSGTHPPPAALFRGIDRAAFAAALSLRLREAGIAVGITSMQSFARALAVHAPESRAGLYWTARISLVRRQPDLAAFDAVFAAAFDAAAQSADPPARHQPVPAGAPGHQDPLRAAPSGTGRGDAGLPWITPHSARGSDDGLEPETGLPDVLPSALAGLADTPFEEFDARELAVLGGWLAAARENWPTRRSRRLHWHRSGRRIAMRATLARARRTGWEPVELVRARPTRRRRRLVMLCDVSQSMQAYATAYLHLMRAAVLSTDAEVFAFATTLTRLTPVLAHRSPAVAISQATARVDDRFGGTRIAANLRALLASHHGGATRGAVVLIASDGWDTDDPAELAAAMARLRRRAHRVIWMNPRSASPGWQPLVGAMAAALPYCDEVLPAHTVKALGEVVAAIGRAG